MAINTRLTTTLGITHPVISAPMAFAAGGALVNAVSNAGGLGLLGGGYGDNTWISQQLNLISTDQFGVGFITWSLQQPILELALQRQPAAVMLSFGDPAPFAPTIHNDKAKLICQCQNLRHVQQAIDAGASIIVAQGTEAGGHGGTRATMSLIPEVADFLSKYAPDTLLVAAGGIADGRGLAAALMLGADGILAGTRFWASSEALVKPGHLKAIINATGDNTLRTRVADIVREIDWPQEFSARLHNNTFMQRWHGDENKLLENLRTEGPKYHEGFLQGDAETTGVWFGEAAGLIHQVKPAAQILDDIIQQASATLEKNYTHG